MTMHRLPALILAAALMNAAAAADAPVEYHQRNAERYVALFTALDRNMDTMVSREEARGDLNFGPRFDDMDINRDGFVTSAELQRFVLLDHGVTVVLK